eukprot:CAMPEP_0201568706 /NCGR_PEP_ID=MMETSP0190_2-20130828/9930_1 /ASSEMBLY_ACC=CAM_ASM_000263 /TAXON_ID=37353 /ORGANISM="Rosalina sp." /LENGTH=337 /DNA_ID=CAMNT_0047990129 /DNA_START=264 /DNA_END=1274 /DNA_ORIENTATION=+
MGPSGSGPKSANTPPGTDPSALMGMMTNPESRKLAKHLSRTAAMMKPKVLGDIDDATTNKLQRLMSRQNSFLPGGHNKLNGLFGKNRLNPLKALTGSGSSLSGAFAGSDGGKEVTFTLEAPGLPELQGKNRAPSIFVRQVVPKEATTNGHDYVLIFLHGAAYTSATWSELGILGELARAGFISYALDIPGFGDSVKTVAGDNRWLTGIIDQLISDNEKVSKHITSAGGVSTAGKKFVLITASMSGRYAVPLLFNKPAGLIGMITVAPVGTNKFKKEQYEKVDIPVCVIYGEEDRKLGEESKTNLIQIPNHKLVVVPGGSHAAYKSDPKFFHQQVVKW